MSGGGSDVGGASVVAGGRGRTGTHRSPPSSTPIRYGGTGVGAPPGVTGTVRRRYVAIPVGSGWHATRLASFGSLRHGSWKAPPSGAHVQKPVRGNTASLGPLHEPGSGVTDVGT